MSRSSKLSEVRQPPRPRPPEGRGGVGLDRVSLDVRELLDWHRRRLQVMVGRELMSPDEARAEMRRLREEAEVSTVPLLDGYCAR